MSLNQQSVALPAVNAYSALVSLLGINFDKPVTFGFSSAEVAGDTFRLLGTMDPAAVDDTNAADLGTVAGLTGLPLPPAIANQLRGWTNVFVQRLTGTNAGTFYVTGEVATPATAVSTAAPAPTVFSAVLDLTGFNADPVRISGSAAMVAGDKFDVYVSQLPGAVSAAGCYYAGRISGGGNDNGKENSLLLEGWPYALVQRVDTGTVTAGTIIACGVSVATGNAPDAVRPLPNTDVRRDGSGGAFNVYEVLAADGATVASAGRIKLAAATETIIAAGAGNQLILTRSAAGFVGIGVATPLAELHVVDPTAGVNVQAMIASSTSSGVSLFSFLNNTPDAGGSSRGARIVLGSALHNWTITQDGGATGIQNLRIGDSDALNRFIIDASGRVALGASNPDVNTLLDMHLNTLFGVGLPTPSRATINAWVSPLTGLSAYDTTNNIFVVNVGTPGSPQWARAAGGPNVRATNANAQSITSGAAAATIITWTATTNIGGAFTAVSGVFVAPVAGFYAISAAAEFASAAAILGAEFRIGIYVGGVLQVESVLVNPVAALAVSRQVQATHMIQLAAGDSVDIRVFQNSGGAIALTATAAHNYLSIALVN